MIGATTERRWLLAGAGWAAQNLWIPALMEAGDGEIQVLDPDHDQLDLCIASWPGVKPVYADPADAGTCDVAVVLTPAGSRVEVARELVGVARRIVLEKPPATTRQELVALAAEAAAAGTEVGVSNSAPYRADVAHFAELCAGLDVRTVSARWVRKNGVPARPTFLQRDQAGGGALIDLGWHLLDILGEVLGHSTWRRKPEVASAELDMRFPEDGLARWRLDSPAADGGCREPDVESAAHVTFRAGTVEIDVTAAWHGATGYDETVIEVSTADGTTLTLDCTLGFSPNRRPTSTVRVRGPGGDESVRQFVNSTEQAFRRQVRRLVCGGAPGGRHGLVAARCKLDMVTAAYRAAAGEARA